MTEPSSALGRGQMLLWAGQKLHPGVPLYNQAFRFEIRAELDPDTFVRAFRQLIEEAPVLRTVIEEGSDGEPRQRLRASASLAAEAGGVFELPMVDFSAEAEPTEACEVWIGQRRIRGFRLDQRTFDSALSKLAEDRWVWYFCQHHTITDADSVRVLFHRLSAIYGALIEERQEGRVPLELVDAGRESREPGAWQEYWQGHADSDQRPPRLYGRAPRSTASRRVELELGEERYEASKALAQRPEIRALTLDMGLFNAFAAVLLAWQFRVGQAGSEPQSAEDGEKIRLALGAPFHNRTRPADQQLTGLLIEVFPLVVELHPGASFLDLLKAVRGATFDFLRHAGPGRSNARQNRQFHTVLNYIRGTFGNFAGLPTTTEWLHPGHHDAEHAVRLHVHDFEGRGVPRLQFDLDEDVFAGVGMERALGHFSRLLDALLDDWHRPIASVPLLSAAEEAEQLARGLPSPSDPTGGSESPATVLAAFEAHLRGMGADAPALVMRGRGEDPEKGGSLSHGELDRASSRLAHRLKPLLGSGGKTPFVGLHMGRSAELIVAMLATWRAGAAYLPIDPTWPAERKAWVARDAGIEWVIASSASDPSAGEEASAWSDGAEVLWLGPDFDLVDLPEQAAEASLEPIGRQLASPDPDSPAYALYTSGSTGRPKGVVISHRALAHYVFWASQRYAVDSPPTYAFFTRPTFDLTLTSIFVPLVGGGRIAIYPETGSKADLALLDVVRDLEQGFAIDVIKLTPSHLALFGDRPEGVGEGSPARLIFGGEALRRQHVRRARELFGAALVHNEYGPTEATVGCIEYAVLPPTSVAPVEGEEGAVPIGRPIRGMGALVLDAHHNLLPDGVSGELYSTGEGLAEGYLARPDLDAERFPMLSIGGRERRYYRTGDRVRWQRIGEHMELVYEGRLDEQLSVRGVRVEPGEIEAALEAHEGIAAAVVGMVVPSAEASAVGGGARSPASAERVHCRRCGLASDFPGIDYDASGLCDQCRAYEAYRDEVERYFRDLGALRAQLDAGKSTREGSYDCLALLSGGKDSTYALARLVDMGYRVLAFTLDNGYISDQAKTNIRRVVDALGVEHVFGTTPAMNRIFVDSLERYSNVCQGCFKTLYTLSLQLAREKGIPFVVTGLSRGQLFETRLTPELFTELGLDSEAIDRTVLEARRAYHRADDAVSRLLDVSHFRDQALFDRVRILDFYRYCDVELGEMYAYLEARLPWQRPTDTGRSTNCLINDLGIWVHRRERGFHNYALPYSWDVRLGHKTRDQALAELDDAIDETAVRRMMEEVGYREREGRPEAAPDANGARRLVAWIAGSSPPEAADLRAFLAARLPDYMLPARFVVVESLPLTPNGKVDRRALEALAREASPEGTPGESAAAESAGPRIEPTTELERRLLAIWSEVLARTELGVEDDFYALGGDSILAIRIAARCHRQGLALDPSAIFDAPTIRSLARHLEKASGTSGAARSGSVESRGEALAAAGPALLGPSQLWCLSALAPDRGPEGRIWNHELRLRSLRTADPEDLRRALHRLCCRFDALRLRFFRDDGQWRAECVADAHPEVHSASAEDWERVVSEAHASLDPNRAPLLAAVVESPASANVGSGRLVLLAHHLVVDALSWPLLLDELASILDSMESGPSDSAEEIGAAPIASFRQWTRALHELEIPTEAESWLAEGPRFHGRLPRSAAYSRADSRSIASQTLELDPAATEVLRGRNRAKSRDRTQAVLVTALASTLGEWLGQRRITFFMEGHGRESGILRSASGGAAGAPSGVVGWLGTLFPIRLTLPATAVSAPTEGGEPAGKALEAVESSLEGLPRFGLGYGIARWLGSDPDHAHRMARLEEADVLFNYLGPAEQLVAGEQVFAFDEPLGLVRGSAVRRPFALEVDAWVRDSKLEIRFGFDANLLDRAVIEQRVRAFEGHLEALLAHLGQDTEAAEPAASDFPLAKLDAAKMKKLSALLGAGSKPGARK